MSELEKNEVQAEVKTNQGELTKLLLQFNADFKEDLATLKNELETKINDLTLKVERLTTTQNSFITGFGNIQQAISQIGGEINQLSTGLIGVSDFCSGLETLMEESKDFTKDNLVASIDLLQSKRKKEELEKAIKDKLIEPFDIIGDDSLIVAVERNSEGKSISSRTQIAVRSLTDKYRKELAKQKAGFVLNLEKGNTLEIKEIYRFVPQPLPKAPEVKEAKEVTNEVPTNGKEEK